MIFQIVASLFLVGIIVYAYSQFRLSPKVAVVTIGLALGGEYFVLFPDSAMTVAHVFGIGRGADLIFYTWILLSLAVAINIYLKLRSTNERFTALVRELALADAARRQDKN
jgi:hypothetical protein